MDDANHAPPAGSVQRVGRQRRRLAKRLQEFLPVYRGFPVTWKPENIHAAQGYYRSSPYNFNGSYRWQAKGVRDGENHAWAFVGSYVTMTELLRAKQWSIDEDDEIDCPTLPPSKGSSS